MNQDYKIFLDTNILIHSTLKDFEPEKYQITGQKIHDTTIVATMIEYEIENILTYNVKDFNFFSNINVFCPEKDWCVHPVDLE